MITVTPPALPVIYMHSQAIFRPVRQSGGSPTGALGFDWEKAGDSQKQGKAQQAQPWGARPGAQLEPPEALPKVASITVLVPTMADDLCGSSLLGPGALLSLLGWYSLLVLSRAPQGSQHTGPGCPSMFTPWMNLEGQDPSQLTSPGTPAC